MNPMVSLVRACTAGMTAASLRTMLVIALASLSIPAMPGTLVSTVPERPDPGAVYLIYMHGRGIDDGARGTAENNQRALRALAKRDFVVVSEQRPTGVRWKFPDDHEKYARRIAAEVGRLLDAGVSAGNIVVSGFSRGGTLTLIVSSLLDRADLRYVVIAGCPSERGQYKDAVPVLGDRYAPKLKGRFLSLRDAADEDFGSCAALFGKAAPTPDFKEVTLSSGRGHAAFAGDDIDWIQPIVDWVQAR